MHSLFTGLSAVNNFPVIETGNNNGVRASFWWKLFTGESGAKEER